MGALYLYTPGDQAWLWGFPGLIERAWETHLITSTPLYIWFCCHETIKTCVDTEATLSHHMEGGFLEE